MPVNNRYVCVHGHFYQPPRENPWFEAIEEQESAAPYHDWNERVCSECYLPNGAARLLDKRGYIKELRNNYASMSFNVGPTLLSWMEQYSPEAYRAIIEADAQSAARFGGHGSAMAQVYSHIIMPLANKRDKVTQVRWGIEDFRMRFHRQPEGMWLSECAVDIDTLEVLAAEGIKFTVLSPYQAAGVRSLWQDNEKDWVDVTGAKIDTRVPYIVQLPSQRTISVFFYDHTIAQAVAFEGLLNNGTDFAERLLKRAESLPKADMPCLANIATDGESYGHHHRYGEMALAFALNTIEKSGRARLTNYGEFLEKFPPTMEVKLITPSSWSCSHGVARWTDDCGCKTGSPSTWTQKWRRPLREALERLRDIAAMRFEVAGQELMPEPWEARDTYIRVINDASDASIEAFLRHYAPAVTSPSERSRVLRLLEMQRAAQLMFTSCGWFFDDLSGIETIQLMRYAARVIDLIQKVFDVDLTPDFLEMLSEARSNREEEGDGATIYVRNIPGYSHIYGQVIAQVAIMDLFTPGFRSRDTHAFYVDLSEKYRDENMFIGVANFKSKITRTEGKAEFAVIGRNDFNVICGLRPYNSPNGTDEIINEFQGLPPQRLRQELHRFFAKDLTFTLQSLMPEALRCVLNTLAQNQREDLRQVLYTEFEKHKNLLLKLTEFKVPLPEHFRQLAEFAINDLLRTEIQNPTANEEDISYVLQWVESGKVKVNTDELGYLLHRRLLTKCDDWAESPRSPLMLKAFLAEARWLNRLPMPVDTNHVQNVFWKMKEQTYSKMDEPMRVDMRKLGELLKVHVE